MHWMNVLYTNLHASTMKTRTYYCFKIGSQSVLRDENVNYHIFNIFYTAVYNLFNIFSTYEIDYSIVFCIYINRIIQNEKWN